MSIYIKYNVHIDHDNITIGNNTYKLLKDNFKSKSSNFLNNFFQKLYNLILEECFNLSNYSSKFC